MRRRFALLIGAMLLAALPGAAIAAPISRSTDHSIGFFCDGISPTSGSGFAFIAASISDTFGPDAFLDYWSTGGPVGPPDVTRDFEQPVSLSFSGGALTGSFAIVGEGGAPAGTATIDAFLEPAGDPVPISESFRFGNRTERFRGVTQPMAISGTVSFADVTFDLASCLADETTITVSTTNPAAFTERFADRSAFCELENASGDTGFVFLGLGTDTVFVDARLLNADESLELGASGELPLVGGSASGSIGLYDPTTWQPVAGEAQITVSFSASERFRYLLRNATARSVITGDLLDIEGSLTFPGGHTFDLGACVGQDATIKSILTPAKGPKSGGKVPANDLPSGAVALTVGSKTAINTKGAAPEAEAVMSCAVLFDFETGEEVVVPVGSTVWYTVQGTGGPITIDTAGSDFDTVVAVYTATGEGFTEVACVDDVPLEPIGRTLQAAATFDTVAGVTYYVQVGGFPESFTYGNLRVAVR